MPGRRACSRPSATCARSASVPSGAGRDPHQARRPVCVDTAGERACFLAYDAINTSVHAVTEARPGAAELVIADVRADIRRARRDGADVIIVVPHWGPEYVTSVTAQQRRWARAMVRAGADVVLGAHSHVGGPDRIRRRHARPLLARRPALRPAALRGRPRRPSSPSSPSSGARLAQLELHPTVIVDRSPGTSLDPRRDGRVVLERMRAAPRRLD